MRFSPSRFACALTERAGLFFATALIVAVISLATSGLAQTTIYNAMPATLAPSYVSQPFQAQQVSEFGDFVHLGGASRRLGSVSLTMVTWAYESEAGNVAYCSAHPTRCSAAGWTHDFTLNIYAAPAAGPAGTRTPGALLATVTQNKSVPWRPEPTGAPCGGTTWQAPDSICYNGMAYNVTFDMSSLNFILPNDIVVGIVYNTQTYGPTPMAENGPFNSLNVSAVGNLSTGTDDNTDIDLIKSATASVYSDGGAAGVNVFREDTGWSIYGPVPIQVNAAPATLIVDDNLACPGASFSTITAAIAAALPGDVIQVCAGSYPEMVNVNKPLTIRGAQAGVDARNRPTTPADESVVSGNAGSTAFYVTASDVVVDGFTIQGNTNVNLFGAGIYVGAGNAGTRLLNNIIQNNIVGLFPSNNSTTNQMVIRRNLFRNNTNPGSASGNGIYSDEYTASGTLQNVLIDNNTFDGNTNAGITLASTDATKPETNITISNNEFKNGGGGFGIYATNVTSSTINGNLFSNITQGIRVNEGTTNLGITCNAVRGGTRGIRFTNTSTGSPLASNVTVNNNDIFGQSLHGIEANPIAYSGTLNAENNWWGSDSGPTVGNLPPTATPGSIAGAVDANPFLTAPAPCAANLIVVDTLHLNGWSSISQRTATGEFVFGPSAPPLGSGSYRMTTGAGNAGPDLPPPGGAGQGGKTWLTTQAYDGTLLADISHLSYSTYVSPSSPTTNLTPSLQFQVDLDGNGTRDSAMIFEPVYSVATQGPITPGVWQNWNARAGKWWFNNATVFGCGSCAYVTYDQVLAAYPNAKIVTWFARTDGYGTQFQAGQNSAGPPWTNFDGNIDNFRIGINSPGDTYDFEPLPCVVVTTQPHIDTLTGVNVNIPVSTPTNLTGRNITATSFVFSYNTSVLSSNPVDIVLTPGAVAPSSTLVVNTSAPGVIEVSVHSATPFVGTGAIVNIQMKVIGPIGSNTPLTLSDLFVYQVDPISIVCSSDTDGDLTVISGTITGNVTYKMDIDSPMSTVTQPVPDAAITASGPMPVPTPAITNSLGNYSMSGFGAGSYTIAASKAAKLCGAPTNGINSNDAAAIAQHVVHLRTLTADQQEAAAVSGLAGPNSLDASLVARVVVCINTAGSLAGTWKFKPLFPAGPVNTIAGGVYNYNALLMGDVTGDWLPGGALRSASSRSKNAVRASVPSIESTQGSTVTVPLKLENLTQTDGISSYQFDIEYDPSVISPADVAASLEGTVGQGLNIVWNAPEAGLLKVAVFGVYPVSGDGVYANLKFKVLGSTGSSTPLAIRGIRYNDDSRPVTAFDGTLKVTRSIAPTKKR